MRILLRLVSAALLILSSHATPLLAQVNPSGAGEFERRELHIPVRDGVTLFAVALVPKVITEPLPILLIRTPYSAAGAFGSDELPANYRELAQDGYIFVNEDIRGRFGSGGEFVMTRMQKDPRSPAGINESTDTYDTIDWLVKNVPHNNGKVGVLGISYPGWLAALAGIGAHPALKAISPQAPMSDTWMGDDFFHQGAFRLTQGLPFASFMETDPKGFHDLPIPDADQYHYYLEFPTLDSLARATGVTTLPSWHDYITHPAWDSYWQAKALTTVFTRAEVPTLFVGGWWDQEDIYGPQAAYRVAEKQDAPQWNHIALGPWYHGGWSDAGGDSLGPIRFGGEKTADYFRAEIQRPWFAYYLHGKGDGQFPEAWGFETGENRWHSFSAWPPAEAKSRNIYLREHGLISFDPPPAGAPASDRFVSDPAKPVPFIRRPFDGSGWRTWLEQDQRFVDGRPDVLTWQSAPLSEDLTIAGDVTAHLFASTTGTDADWVVKLIDVYPDTVSDRPGMGGFELMVSADIMRGRYWKGFARATPIPANVATPFTVDLHQQLYRFLKGHRIMVQVQSSWFPLYDRNPQHFVANIFHARASDYRVQEHRVWHTAKYPSHVTVGVMP